MKVVVMGMLRRRSRGQNMIEYAFVVSIVAAAAVAMSTYVYRAVQSKQGEMTKAFLAE